MTMRGTEEPRTPHRVQGGPRRRAAPRSRSGSAPRAARTARAPLRLTGRGAIVGIVLVSFGAALLAQALGTPVADGAGFLAACVLAALLVRRSDLLSLVVSPPLAYFAAALAAELVLTMAVTSWAAAWRSAWAPASPRSRRGCSPARPRSWSCASCAACPRTSANSATSSADARSGAGAADPAPRKASRSIEV